MLVTLAEAKQFLRVDIRTEDDTIAAILSAAESLCLNVARMDETEARAYLPAMKEAVLYTTSFMYGHRDEADYATLLFMLRALLSQVRKEQF